jgi:hypothetical protein
MRNRVHVWPGLAAIGALACVMAGLAYSLNGAQDETSQAGSAQAYARDVQPLLKRFCHECHAGEDAEAEIDLAAFNSIGDIRRDLKVWLKVREMLDSGQMPPNDAAQPAESERTLLKTWVRQFLTIEAAFRAGDPGPVALRRLSNAEYTYTIRDLTGVEGLDPTREFPVDGAAGEGFTNSGAGQGMSPALVTKYLDAAKEVADHAVLLPDGIGFSPSTTRRDRTDELLARIQEFYRQFTDDGGGSAVNLQGIKFDTNQGGRLPLQKYLAATLQFREALASGQKSIERVAKEQALNARYLAALWNALSRESSEPPSLLLDAIRDKWKAAGAADVPALAAEIARAQEALFKFNPVGHIGREDGPTCYLEGVSLLRERQEVNLPLPAAPDGGGLTLYLATSDLGDGNQHDYVVWQRPRLEFESGRTILLRDLRGLAGRIEQALARELPRTLIYLQAVAELRSSSETLDVLAARHELNPELLRKWSELCGFSRGADRRITGHFTDKQAQIHGYAAINGWGRPETPSLLTNRSEEAISFLTLTVPARGVTVHPSPQLDSIVAWRSPVDGEFRIQGLVADADDKCGNGAAWRVELAGESGIDVLAEGIIENGGRQPFQSEKAQSIRSGDVVSLIVNARDGSHACDTTHIELKLSETGGAGRVWNLATDIVDNVLDANPHADAYGHADVWHFCAGDGKPQDQAAVAANSALASWCDAVRGERPRSEIDRWAAQVQLSVTRGEATALSPPDQQLRRQVTDWKGVLDWINVAASAPPAHSGYGIEPEKFGAHPHGQSLDPAHLCLQAPSLLEVRLPADLAAGAKFLSEVTLHTPSGNEGSAQAQALVARPAQLNVSPALPILVGDAGQSRRRLEAACDEFRSLFPPTLCYARIVPVDEVVTLTLYYREDDHLKRLMLSESQIAELDRLWDALYFVSQEPIALTVAFEQIAEFATQDRPDLVEAFKPLRQPILDRADKFRQRLVETEPVHVEAVLELAERAWRRPLNTGEQRSLRELYQALRAADIPHDEAIRLTIARVLTAPAFLYKLEQPAPAQRAAPVSPDELAVRMSYFLWSSCPDGPLRLAAREGKLTEDDQLLAQTRRMLADARTRRMAVQFACQWLHVRDFDVNDDKNEKLFPEFATLRGEMYEETVRFFEDMFRNDGSILWLLDADHTFLNEALAGHYGIEDVRGAEWRRVAGIRSRGRGGILAMATILASQSGASRTSPILRGNWVSETLLGERLPRPPANVPQLPDTVPSGLTERQLIERHSSVPECAKCHAKIDPYGFALEQYDAIGRLRSDPVDTRTTLLDGQPLEGIDGLRDYLAGERRNDVVRQFCRKLLGYALGREIQLSDEVLLDKMQSKLEANDYRFHVAIEAIVTSRQFRDIRGRQMTDAE